MKRTEKRIRAVTSRKHAREFEKRGHAWGQDPAVVAALTERLRKPTRKLGGVSDMHIEQMENMTPEELEALELGSP